MFEKQCELFDNTVNRVLSLLEGLDRIDTKLIVAESRVARAYNIDKERAVYE